METPRGSLAVFASPSENALTVWTTSRVMCKESTAATAMDLHFNARTLSLRKEHCARPVLMPTDNVVLLAVDPASGDVAAELKGAACKDASPAARSTRQYIAAIPGVWKCQCTGSDQEEGGGGVAVVSHNAHVYGGMVFVVCWSSFSNCDLIPRMEMYTTRPWTTLTSSHNTQTHTNT
eukprot:Opistho-2@53051